MLKSTLVLIILFTLAYDNKIGEPQKILSTTNEDLIITNIFPPPNIIYQVYFVPMCVCMLTKYNH